MTVPTISRGAVLFNGLRLHPGSILDLHAFRARAVEGQLFS